MYRFDEQVASLASAHGLVYTRYADDLIFSTSSQDFSRDKARKLVQLVYEKMIPMGLRPHTAKTVIAPPGARKVVLGLLVDRDRPRLRREFRAALDQHIYCLVKNGPAVHAERRGFRSIFSLEQYIAGLINYASQIDPVYGAALELQMKAVVWPF